MGKRNPGLSIYTCLPQGLIITNYTHIYCIYIIYGNKSTCFKVGWEVNLNNTNNVHSVVPIVFYVLNNVIDNDNNFIVGQ